MSVEKFYFNASRLPDDVLSYMDETFYNFAETFLGKLHARLLSYLQINSVPCFLLTDNPCDVFTMDVEDEVLEELSKEMCIKLKNNQLIVKPGVHNSFRCLKQLLLKKIEEQLKKKKRKEKHQIIASNNTTSTQPFALSASTSNSSLSLLVTSTPSLTIDQHREYLLNFIRQWCIDNKTIFQLNELELKENIDFSIFFTNNDHFLEASIKCNCGSKINLGKNLEKFQLSNYYKHLKDSNCSHIQTLKKKEQDKMLPQQQTGTHPIITSSDATNPQIMSTSSDTSASSLASIGNRKRHNNSQNSQKKTKQKKEH